MSDFADFKTQIAEWANRGDWSDTLVTSFVRMAEQKLNAELRVARMIVSVDGQIVSCCANIPDDWLEFDFILVASSNSPSGWIPIRYKPRDEFYRLPQNAWTANYYTIEGRRLYFGGAPDTVNGKTYRLHYFAKVPVFSDAQDSWVYDNYPSLYLSAAMMHAYMHAVGEEAQAAGAKQLAEDTIAKLNNEFNVSKASGSRLARSRIRSFG